MDKYWVPYLILMALLLSGSVWIVLISRRGKFGPVRDQWLKYLVYLFMVNFIWWGLVLFESGSTWIGVVLMAGAIAEWIHICIRKRVMWWPSLLFAVMMAGFGRSFALEKNLILNTYFVVVLFDGSGQVFGQMFGKRALAPRISPRKTVEGLAGATLITMAAALLSSNAFSIPLMRTLWLSPMIMAAALLGDLLASAMKRRMGLDTFSKVIPGHGGVLDRFDSWMVAGAACFLIFLFIG